MSITINIYYSGKNGNARKFVNEMIESGIVSKIQNEDGNEKYEYFFPINDLETVLLIDRWTNQESLDIHHKLPLMNEISTLREKYDLHMKVERYLDDSNSSDEDNKFIRK